MTRTFQRLLLGGLLFAAPAAFADASVDGTPAPKPPVGRRREPAKPGKVRQPDPTPPEKPEKVGKTRAPDPDFGHGAEIGTARQAPPDQPPPVGTERRVEPVPPRERKVGKTRAPEPKPPEKMGITEQAPPERASPPPPDDKPKYGPAPSGK